MRGHRILTLFAVEVAAMFALTTAMSMPAASIARANPAENLKAVGSVSEPGPGDGNRDRDNRDRDRFRDRDRERDNHRNRQQDDTQARVKVRQDNEARQSSRSNGWHHESPPCFRCHRHHVHHQHREVHMAPAPAPVSLPVTGRSSEMMAVGGAAAVLTGAALLGLSSTRRRRLPAPKSVVGSAA
jgi:hypothetical protein